MKQLTLALLLIATTTSFSQTVNGIPLKELNVEYVQIVGTRVGFSATKVSIQLDFGQKQSVWTGDDTKLLDATGKSVKLNSMIDALNFMNSNGYEFITAYVTQNVYHYLLKKNK
jgi:hypothetical protein